ncbi:hypothetical protein VTL71DRAFT_14436 [Oculimacula yallundae]|uniref:Uncharacterized protein n=1 Tax=Oculimacula yallundae TaxID=86028 RepID=A0ABR4CIF8_9HELO
MIYSYTHFLSALCLSATTTAYVIDTDSCNTVAQEFLAEKLTCAFDMATKVVTELRKPSIGREVQTLMDHLWVPTANPADYPTPQEAILCRFDGTCPTNKFRGSYFLYTAAGGSAQFPRGILSMADPAIDVQLQSGATGAAAGDVVFYCSSERYKDITDQDGNHRIKDTSIIEFVADDEEDPRKICNLALAYTWASPDATKPSQITLCPWFLEYAQGLKLPRCGTWRQKLVGLIGRPTAWLGSRRWPYTAIDLLSLFDKVVVHELTHTRHGGKTVDVAMDGRAITFNNVAYGWRNCKKISTNLPDNDGRDELKPMNNADSYAIFASGVRIINAGGSIDEKGNVKNAPSSSKAKRAPLTAEEREELGFLAAVFDEESSDSANEAEMAMWGPVFNSTFFPEGTSLSEEQKGMVVKALMGEMPGEAAHVH